MRRSAAAAFLVVSLGLANVAFAVSQTVMIRNLAFGPQAVTVNVGESVTWRNSEVAGYAGGGPSHTATANNGAFDTGPIVPGATNVVVFALPGVYAYHCSIHPSMTGTVTVIGAAATTAPPTTPQATPAPTTAAAATPPSGSVQPPGSPTPSPIPSQTGAVAAATPTSAAAAPSGSPAPLAVASPSTVAAVGAEPTGGAGKGLGAVLAAGAVALAVVAGGLVFGFSRRNRPR